MDPLSKNRAFRAVYGCGKSAANHLLVVYALPNPSGTNRLGVSVSRKVGKAVVRNRIKRLIKENVRMLEINIKQGYDIVVVARSQAGKIYDHKAFYHIGHALRYLLLKLKLL